MTGNDIVNDQNLGKITQDTLLPELNKKYGISITTKEESLFLETFEKELKGVDLLTVEDIKSKAEEFVRETTSIYLPDYEGDLGELDAKANNKEFAIVRV